MSIEHYPKIRYREGYLEDEVIENAHFYIEEKIDGSQFRFSVSKYGETKFGSHHVEFQDGITPKGWATAIEGAKNAIQILQSDDFLADHSFDEITFFCEYLQKPKHNTLNYGRIPEKNLYLFDILFTVNGKRTWAIPSYTEMIAEKIGLEKPHIIEILEHIPTNEHLEEIVENKMSVLGNTKMEGVVVKSDYEIKYNNYPYPAPFMYKYVRKNFKEENGINWKQNNPSPMEFVTGLLNKEGVWLKIVARAKDEGRLKGEIQDMKVIIEMLQKEFAEEYDDYLKEEIYKHFKPFIVRSVTKGLPEYYKRVLQDGL